MQSLKGAQCCRQLALQVARRLLFEDLYIGLVRNISITCFTGYSVMYFMVEVFSLPTSIKLQCQSYAQLFSHFIIGHPKLVPKIET